MALSQLQSYIEKEFPESCVQVDLLKIAKAMCFPSDAIKSDPSFQFGDFRPPQPFCLAIDGECCLNRLYGGYLGDWVCGGQWNRMLEFLTNFTQSLANSNIMITVFFDGTVDSRRMKEWSRAQISDKQKITSVLRHLYNKGTPPPKALWVPPNCLRTSVRMALKHLQVEVVFTLEDHRREIVKFIKEYRYHALVADDPEYVVFNPPRYFSASNLKMSFRGFVETKEYVMNEMTRGLNLHPSRLCLVASLLANHILSEKELANFHRSLCPGVTGQLPFNTVIKAVVDFVRNLDSVDDLESVSNLVFGKSDVEVRIKFKSCVRYYCMEAKNETAVKCSESKSQSSQQIEVQKTVDVATSPLQSVGIAPLASSGNTGSENTDTNSSNSSIQAYRQLLGDCEQNSLSQVFSYKCDMNNSEGGSFVSDDTMSPTTGEFYISPTGVLGGITPTKPLAKPDQQASQEYRVPVVQTRYNTMPPVCADVMQVARERHRTGKMSPEIYQILSHGEIRIPVTFEDVGGRDLPLPSVFYRSLRQMVYAALFNQHHHSFAAQQMKEKEGKNVKPTPIMIKEWLYRVNNKYSKPDLVYAKALGWAVPTVSRLWFGNGSDDNDRRFRAFLTCMRSSTALMRDASYVPTRFIIPCCVLRYILTNPSLPVLQKTELDAFLVQAVDPRLGNLVETEKLQVPVINVRAVYLASLFMEGVENALLANEACGAPVPTTVCYPWRFFDGKLFQETLLKISTSKNLVDLCDGNINQIALVERMRNAILEAVAIPFSPYTLQGGAVAQMSPYQQVPVHRFEMPSSITGAVRRKRKESRGGQLEVGGSVVGSWGANTRMTATPSKKAASEMTSPLDLKITRHAGTVTASYYPAGIGLSQTIRQASPYRPVTKDVGIMGGAIGPGLGVTGVSGGPDDFSVFHGIGRGCTIESAAPGYTDFSVSPQNYGSRMIDQSSMIQQYYDAPNSMEHGIGM